MVSEAGPERTPWRGQGGSLLGPVPRGGLGLNGGPEPSRGSLTAAAAERPGPAASRGRPCRCLRCGVCRAQGAGPAAHGGLSRRGVSPTRCPCPGFCRSPGVRPAQRGHVTSSRCPEPSCTGAAGGSCSDRLSLCRPRRRTSWLGLAWSPSASSSLFTTPSGSSYWYGVPLADIIPVAPRSGVSLAFVQAMM